jgi:hypothetical protein
MQLSRLFLLFLATALLAVPARAQTISLYCTNPNLRFSYFADVDYAANTVAYRMDAVGVPGKTYSARITDSLITWEEPGNRNYSATYYTLSRITGQLNACDTDGCNQRVCKPAQRQF